MRFHPLLRAVSAFVFIAVLGTSFRASADTGLLSSCGRISRDQTKMLLDQADYQDLMVMVRYSANTCNTATTLLESAQAVNMVLMPALFVLKTPGVPEELAKDLAGMSLTLANPAVLGVTVLGAFGYVTVYYAVKLTVDDCKKQEVQDQIKQEVEEQLHLQIPKPLTIQIH